MTHVHSCFNKGECLALRCVQSGFNGQALSRTLYCFLDCSNGFVSQLLPVKVVDEIAVLMTGCVLCEIHSDCCQSAYL